MINKKNLSKFNIPKHYLPFIILFGLGLIITMYSHIQVGDDTVFTDAFRNNNGVIDWIKNYTSIWSGRIIPHFILIILLNCNIIVWKILNSLVLSLLGLGIFKLIINVNSNFNEYDKTKFSILICSIIFFIPASVISSSVLWVTGSFTYLWSTAFGIIALIPFKRTITNEPISKKLLIISFISSFYACYVEQSAAILIAFSIISILYSILKKEKVEYSIYALSIFIFINSFISLSAPGNSLRNTAEILRWYPDFDMLSFIDKLFLGLSITFDYLFNTNIFPMTIFCCLIMILTIIKNTDYFTKLLSSFPFIYCCCKLLGVDILFKFLNIDTLFVSSDFKKYIPIFCALCIAFIILYLLIIIYNNINENFIVMILFGGSLCESIIMGISPTIFASGSRIFFVTDILLLICILLLFYFIYIIKYDILKSKKIFVIIPSIIALILCLNYAFIIAPQSYF